MDLATLDSIVAKVYSSAAGRLQWDAAFNDLARCARAWAIHLVAFNKRTGGVLFSHHGGEATPQTNLDYVRKYHKIDPRGAEIVRGPMLDWFHCHEHFDDSYVATSPFYQDFLIPYGGRYVTLSKIADANDVAIVLGVHRGSGSKPVEPDTLLWLDRIRFHLVEAMGVYQRLRELQFEHAVGREILDRLAYPLVLVDSLRGLVFRNSAAAEALNARDYIVDQGGMLACSNQSDDAALTIAIQNLGLQETDPSRPRTMREAVRIRRRNCESRVSAFLSALRPSEVMGTFGTSSVALIVFHDPKALPCVDPFILAEAFDLTPAEAKIAVEVSHGKTAVEVAAARSVALGTVRAQIKSALAKTGVHRQSDLVRLVVSLPHM